MKPEEELQTISGKKTVATFERTSSGGFQWIIRECPYCDRKHKIDGGFDVLEVHSVLGKKKLPCGHTALIRDE